METNSLDLQTILDSIPHRPPFLFVEEIRQWSEEKIITAYRFTGEEFFFAGHYPGSPIVPGVLLCEAAMQAGAVYLAKRFAADAEKSRAAGKSAPRLVPVVGRMNEVKFKRIVHPLETILCEVTFKEKMGTAWFLSAKVTVDGALAVRFDFACTQTAAAS